MSLELTTAGADVRNVGTLTGAPAVRLAAADIRFTNTERGRVLADHVGSTALIIDASGAQIVNLEGGIIDSIAGSPFADVVDNAGVLYAVSLGDGDDRLINRAPGLLRFDLGAGDDRFELIGRDYGVYSPSFGGNSGGTGQDTLVLSGQIGQIFGGPGEFAITGFEALVVGPEVVNLVAFSNYATITLLPSQAPFANQANFIDSRNPLAAIALDGTAISLAGDSVVLSVTGGAGTDYLSLASTASGVPALLSPADLGGGDDSLRLAVLSPDVAFPLAETAVDGGAGYDTLEIVAGEGQTLDAFHLTGFEYLNAGNWTSAVNHSRVTNLNGFTDIRSDEGELIIAQSTSPDAVFSTRNGGRIVIEASTVLGRYALRLPGFGEVDVSAATAPDLSASVTVLNRGWIKQGVALGQGDDLFDGRQGITDGAITASAGNDTVYAGTGAAWISGGAGADDLFGNNGADTLFGDAGGDRLDGGSGNDSLYGGSGDDLFQVDGQGDLVFESIGGGNDTVEASASFYLYGNIEGLTLTADAGNAFGVGNDLDNIIIGNAGDNLLIAHGGRDTVLGGAGNDQLYGLAGDDSLLGQASIDYLIGGDGNDTLDGGDDADALYGEAGNDLLIGGASFSTDIFIAGDGNDTIRADSGLGDFDLMDGGAGDDVYYVDNPFDASFEAARGGIDTVYADIAGNGYYLYGETENLILLGTTPFGVGNELANRITGNAAGNYLLGGAGNDTLDGGAGGDVLFGQAGADVFVFGVGTGGDVIGDFEAGIDRIDLSAFGLASYADLASRFVEVAGTSAINLGNGDFIVINGVTNAQLGAASFLLG